MKLSVGLAEERLCCRGAIILLKNVCLDDGKTHNKYIVVLNSSSTFATILFVLTTSKVDFYNRHANLPVVRIPSNKLACFPLETIIDCREVRTIARADLLNRYREDKIEYVDRLDNSILDTIVCTVCTSRTVSEETKKQINPDYGKR